jgi:hypothetical protein
MTTTYPRLPNDHLCAIGKVAVRSGQLDWHVERLTLVAFRRQPETAKFLLKNLGADRVVSLMKAVLLDAAPEHENLIVNLDSEINRLKSERNSIMHWIWGESDHSDTAIHLSARSFREHHQKTRTAQEIQRIADS